MASLAYTYSKVVADIALVLDTRHMEESKMFIIDKEVFVSHKYCGHNIITHFYDYGRMNSYEADIEEFIDETGHLDKGKINALPHVFYDIHHKHGEKNRADAFYKLLRDFLKEE